MLSISLGPEEYVTIGDDIVVKVSRMAKGRCFLAIEADRTVPIVRGTVREREGAPPPECIAARPPRKRPRCKPDAVYRWNDDRERAVRIIEKMADQLEEKGAAKAARLLRMQVDQLVPDAWEEELKAN